jgi:hypothetical protein
MFHLIKIEEIQHLDVDGSVLWSSKDLDNMFHTGGEQFLLSVAFNTTGGISIPNYYYLGLDNRNTLASADSLTTVSSQEPSSNGYSRQPISSASGFSIAAAGDGNYRATSGIVTFTAAGGSWGPVQNLFMSTTIDNSGYLIGSVSLGGSRTLTNGQSTTMRISLGLKDC